MAKLNRLGKSLTEVQMRIIYEKMADAHQEFIYQYSWDSLENDLKNNGFSSLPVVAYGSLVNPKSAAVTFQDNSKRSHLPVIAFGVRRIFNYEMSTKVRRYGPVTGRNRAALNVETTEKIDDVVNGILFEIALEEIPAFRGREKGYDLVPVATISWNEINDPPFLAYILRCPDGPIDGKSLTNDQIDPHKQYYLTCRGGAHEIGEDFLHFWLETTFLADKVTPVSQWEVTEFPELGKIDNGEVKS